MRKKRLLVQDAWYEVQTAINNREPLFRRRQAIEIFCRVFGEARERFDFELRGFRLVEERLSFYIKPADGLQLPAIMQWLKQTFAVRFNLSTERTGHVWGDQYWSRVLEGEPPEWAEEANWKAVDVAAETGEISFGTWPPDGVSPLMAENPAKPDFCPNPRPIPAFAQLSTEIRLKTPRGHRRNHPPQGVSGRPRERSVRSSTSAASQKANADALIKSGYGRP